MSKETTDIIWKCFDCNSTKVIARGMTYTIHKPDHERHGRQVQVINKSAAFRNQNNEPFIDKNQWIVEEIETKDRYIVSKHILK